MTLKELRARSNLSQKQVAASLSITQQLVSKWENGKGLPTISSIVTMAKLLNVNEKIMLSCFIRSQDEK